MKSKDRTTLKRQINKKLADYYENYYRVQLGLRDWEARVQNRLREEEYLGKPNLDKIESWMDIDFAGKRVLVVGAGTGAESIVLHRRGAKVYGIEPNSAGIEILHLKADLCGMPRGRFRRAGAEHIPYKTNYFDFVYCYTVIEHVEDIDKSIDEMIRVCKVRGWIFIQTGDYRFPYEWHYKKPRLPFSPKWFTYLHFALLGRPVGFLKTINFVTAPQLDRKLMKRNVEIFRISPPWIYDWKRSKRPNLAYLRFIERFGIGRDQNIFLKKRGQPE